MSVPGVLYPFESKINPCALDEMAGGFDSTFLSNGVECFHL